MQMRSLDAALLFRDTGIVSPTAIFMRSLDLLWKVTCTTTRSHVPGIAMAAAPPGGDTGFANRKHSTIGRVYTAGGRSA